MGKIKKAISLISVLILTISTLLGGSVNTVYAAQGWNKDSTGWYYMNGGSYYAGRWAEIGGYWYYFTSDGYMDYSEYRDGCWLESNGLWNRAYSNGSWKNNSIGWWFEDNNWYPTNQWLWINGSCYFFGSDGYMEYNCYRDGCWLGSDGAWNPSYSGGTWHFDGQGWWFEDNGWYPQNQMLKIDGVDYWFDASGYWDKEKSPKGKGDNHNDDGSDGGDSSVDVTAYSYKVTPLLPPFNDYFFIETDNPDFESFRFVDKNSKYKDEIDVANISPCTSVFMDVVYTDKENKRVSGGYITVGYNVAGGDLVLQSAKKYCEEYEYGTSTWFDYSDTDIIVSTNEVVDNIDYLIQNYKGNSNDFFGEMSSIQAGFNDICLYDGAYVFGDLVRGKGEWGISDSIHKDQNFYIQDPYYSTNDKSLLVSNLYPYIYDSVGFPNMMYNVAERLGYNFSAEWNSSWHDMIDFTYNGKTESYGGAGHGGGQGIYDNMIKYYYTFDGSAGDASKEINLSSLSQKLNSYGSLDVEERTKDGEISWADVRKKVGDGSYVKLDEVVGFNDDSETGFTFMYDNNADPKFDYWDWGNIGHFSYAWYDGRFFNGYEVFEKGIKFGDKSFDGSDTSHARIILKDVYLPIPDATQYWMFGKYDSLEDLSKSYTDFDPNSKKWHGYMEYSYDYETGNWVFWLCNSLKIYNEETQKYELITDPDFLDACIITPEEIKKMNIDINADVDPTEYYSYDEVEKPGTYHNSKTN